MEALWLIGFIVGIILVFVLVIQMARGASLTAFGMLQLIAGIILLALGLIHFGVVSS